MSNKRLNKFLIVKTVVVAFNKVKALVVAFSVIVKLQTLRMFVSSSTIARCVPCPDTRISL